ncbi:hypothetical protein ACT3SP_01150 [Brachybacterium sp. AOP43-C2-M15]|uniref:hypothetical protein n=1 Tax=Brachybacterium sp. AOP43-C2-M15 TaxID=3457661 RepID=UPI004034A4AD
MTASRTPLRLLRGGTAASLATAVALGGHLVGGGAPPSWLGIAIPWWLAVTACTVLAGTRFSLPRMVAAVVTSQALFHGLFTAGTPGDPGLTLVAPPGSHLGHGAHGAHGPGAIHTGTIPVGTALEHSGPAVTGGVHGAGHGAGHGVAEVAEHALHGSHGDLRMLLWHLAAALVTSLLLHRGESFLLRCAALVGAVLTVLADPPHGLPLPRVVLPRPARPVPDLVHLPPAQRAVLAPQLRRGPPLVLAA